MSRTTSCVCEGACAKSYSQGTSTEGSLPIHAYGLLGPSFNLEQKASRRFTTVELPPILSDRPRRSKETIQVYWAESPSWKPFPLVGWKPLAQAPLALRGWT